MEDDLRKDVEDGIVCAGVAVSCPVCGSLNRTSRLLIVCMGVITLFVDLRRQQMAVYPHEENRETQLISTAFDCDQGHRYLVTIAEQDGRGAEISVEYKPDGTGKLWGTWK